MLCRSSPQPWPCGSPQLKCSVYESSVLTYRHELGMNYNFVLPDLIVGSCLQTPSDVDRLKEVGVKTVFCLQQDPDLEYFGVDICAIQERAKEIGGIEHIRAQIRDFDPFDLRQRLPAVVAVLNKAVQRNKGITYIHCTAGLGRAPAVALAYMYWLLGYELLKANEMLLSVRPCFPKLEAIRNATCDLLTGGAREMIPFKWPDDDCQKVEISGLDVGWGQMLPLTFVSGEKYWRLNRELLVGKYEYKYVVDGIWTTNPHEPLTEANKDGHINNFVEVIGESEDAETKNLRQRLMQDSPPLNDTERQIIHQKLLSLSSD
ncbi:hypothetical protein L7F22_033635 [Adiantum nelumboides]|nr:hypothetical protein [Adiantum nelumboides]